MASSSLYRTVTFAGTAIACVLFAGFSFADKITFEGVRYKDVIVVESPTSYYIQLPKEGRILLAPKAKVDASTVEINRDPFYRDELKAQFDKAKASGSTEKQPTEKPTFKIDTSARIDTGGGAGSISGGAGGGGGGGAGPSSGAAGLGSARSQLQSMLQGMMQQQGGGQFQDGPVKNGFPTVILRTPEGFVELIGPPDKLMGITMRATGPAAAMAQQIPDMMMLLTMAAPGAAAQLRPALGQLASSGAVDTTAGGARLKATITTNGDQQTLDLSLMSVN